MDKGVIEVIDNCFSRILEDSSFMFIEPSDKEYILQKKDVDFYISYITFSGDVNGEIIILFSMDTAKEICMNMLGIEPEEMDKSYVSDSIGEFSNMFCGNVVFQIFGKDKDYDISIPVLNKGHEEYFETLISDGETRYYTIDDNPVLLNIKF